MNYSAYPKRVHIESTLSFRCIACIFIFCFWMRWPNVACLIDIRNHRKFSFSINRSGSASVVREVCHSGMGEVIFTAYTLIAMCAFRKLAHSDYPVGWNTDS